VVVYNAGAGQVLGEASKGVREIEKPGRLTGTLMSELIIVARTQNIFYIR